MYIMMDLGTFLSDRSGVLVNHRLRVWQPIWVYWLWKSPKQTAII